MDLPFVDMTYKLLCKDKIMVEIESLKYGASSKYVKKSYPKREENKFNVVNKPKEIPKPTQLSIRDSRLKLPIAPYIMFRDYVEKRSNPCKT